MRRTIAASVGALMIAALAPTPPAVAETAFHCLGWDSRTAVAGGETSCPFARNVRSAWFGQPGNPVLACSPVTGDCYHMMCVHGFDLTFNDGLMVTGATRCVDASGGTAIVYVW